MVLTAETISVATWMLLADAAAIVSAADVPNTVPSTFEYEP